MPRLFAISHELGSCSQLPYLLKILGYVMGDGNIHYVGQRGKGITWFYGKTEDLESIRADITKLGFTPSKIYLRDREHHIETSYDTYEFSTQETSFKVCGSAFATLLVALGAPLGKKASQDYEVPAWIFKAPLWQKRLFLAVTNHVFQIYQHSLKIYWMFISYVIIKILLLIHFMKCLPIKIG